MKSSLKWEKRFFSPLLCRRCYMSNSEISKFKIRKSSREPGPEELKKPTKVGNAIRGNHTCSDLTTPFEIYKWSHILNTKNERLIDDVIRQVEGKKKKKRTGKNSLHRDTTISTSKETSLNIHRSEDLSASLDLHRAAHRYHIVINDKENDIYVENEISTFFSNVINTLEDRLHNNPAAMRLLKRARENESHIFYYLYNNFKIVRVLPYKCFWRYEYTEDIFPADHTQNQEGQDNEYLFKNIDLNKLDLFLRGEEDMLSVMQKKRSSKLEGNCNGNERDNLNEQQGGANHKFKFVNREEGVLRKSERYHGAGMNDISPSQIEKENPSGRKAVTDDVHTQSGYHFLTTPFGNKPPDYSPWMNPKRFLSTVDTSNNENTLHKMRSQIFHCAEKFKDIDIASQGDGIKRDNRGSTAKSDNLKGYAGNSSTCAGVEVKKDRNIHIEREEPNDAENISHANMVDEQDFNYDIDVLNNKIICLDKSERTNFRISKVPVSPLSRATVFGKVLLDIAKNSSLEYIKSRLANGFGGGDAENSPRRSTIVSEKNAEILAKGLSKMRGVVLKLGQMISLQDEHLSPILGKALKLVSNSADVMPMSQLRSVLKEELGKDYEKKFDSFDYVPFASASIGQVHKAKINNKIVAVKIQYPGVYESIDSDMKNLLLINQYTNLILKNLYIENVCREIKKELKCECDYINEAKYYVLFKNIFKSSKYFYVPSVYTEYVTKHVLVTSYVEGLTLDEVAVRFPQAIRDSIGQRILYLCLHELFVFKIMNTDPNLGNFLYDQEKDKLCLIDFGATRSYKNEFVDNYLRLVKASVEEDQSKIYHYSYELNFFVGKEIEEMKNSHIKSVILVGEPFKYPVYDFANNDIAKQIYKLLPKIIYNRLVPPRSEIYTLHRKLSGSFLICMKLKAKVEAAHIFNSIYNNYKFTTEDTYLRDRLRTC
ncbi:Atypical/ABC1/ABC1-A protein kinase [Plasmodium inui San Antonio 1]|uniref:Atypical/ABC1/ABC1-A protein kinase n=1 Tax=Plasmodium inui San Antonio 1 TaxID=1237626 RepID=W7ACC1_9APIC|nr:Atypical/ABC1/ABC1-A protein kinase [Plasmodium inui San Antonio 1]EUD68978.1 Atypical/ABC1/ABC1-A protein kinase [Plasmodium inui San Antonio 1]